MAAPTSLTARCCAWFATCSENNGMGKTHTNQVRLAAQPAGSERTKAKPTSKCTLTTHPPRALCHMHPRAQRGHSALNGPAFLIKYNACPQLRRRGRWGDGAAMASAGAMGRKGERKADV